MNIYNLSGFQWWCKQRRNSSILASAFMVFFLVVFCSGFASNLKTNNISNTSIDKGAVGILVIMFVFFIVMLLSFIRIVIRNMQIKVDEYWSGTITNFYIKRYGSTNNRKRRYYIVANVNGKEMDARCMPQTYRKAQQGQQIIVFSVKGDRRLYCVHPEM